MMKHSDMNQYDINIHVIKSAWWLPIHNKYHADMAMIITFI